MMKKVNWWEVVKAVISAALGAIFGSTVF